MKTATTIRPTPPWDMRSHPQDGHEDNVNPSWVAGVLTVDGDNYAGADDNTNQTKLTGAAYVSFGSIPASTPKILLCIIVRAMSARILPAVCRVCVPSR